MLALNKSVRTNCGEIVVQTRRHFLQQAAGAVALATLPLLSHAVSAGINLGFSLYGMKTLPVDEALRVCADTGYRNVELVLNQGYPTEPKLLSAHARTKLRNQLALSKLDVSGLMLNMSLTADDKAHSANLESIRTAAQLAYDLVPENPPVIETVLGGKPLEWGNVKDFMAARLLSWAEVARAGNIILAIKAHVGNAVNSPDRLLWLLQNVSNPAIKVAYDYSHFELQGFSLADSLKALLPHTHFIHVKDSSGDATKFQFLLPGEGHTDYVAYFRMLKQSNYNGPVVVEVSGQVFNRPGYDPIVAAKKCYKALSAAIART